MAKLMIEIPDEEIIDALEEAASYCRGHLNPNVTKVTPALKNYVAMDIATFIRNDLVKFFRDGIANELYDDYISCE